ncbi:hypothetical protein APHAL10511_004151 [Amanita phalloides]|nr:hypothetical protein APHAL10511_004151 [Amanita phalloides]
MQIVDRVEDVRKKVGGLRKVYVMTNAKEAWLEDVKVALLEIAGGEWEMVKTTRDLALSWEQKPVKQALDMYVAQRARAFIGNGFSSFTSNDVMLRMGNPLLSPRHTFFW